MSAITGLAIGLALAWMLFLLASRPDNPRLRAATALVGSWGVAHLFRGAANRAENFLGLDPMGSRLAEHIFALLGCFSLVCFFLFSAFKSSVARRHMRWHTLPLGIAVAALVVTSLSIPSDLRDAAAHLTTAPGNGPVSVTAISLFYLTANTYILLTVASAAVLTRRYMRDARPPLRHGLAIVLGGLSAATVACAVFAVANITRWLGTPLARPVLLVGGVLAMGGIAATVAGLAYPASIMRVGALRLWIRHRRDYHSLGPLWTALNSQFPQDVLHRTSATRTPGLRDIHRRYYRRVIECRDGLVRVSPHINQLRRAGHHAPLPELLPLALQAYAERQDTDKQAIPLVVPSGDGLNADVAELIALSRALPSGIGSSQVRGEQEADTV